MIKRKIVRIDEEKCNGCGECIPACHEGAIQIIDGKAKLIKDKLCDGLGDCLGECPQGAIEIIERVADPYDEDAVKKHLASLSGHEGEYDFTCGCTSEAEQLHFLDQRPDESTVSSTLKQWPVQLKLLPVTAPFFAGAKLLLVADCVPVAYANYQELQKGKAIAMGCPKLDDKDFYIKKLSQIIESNTLESILIARMEVPCCSGLETIVKAALAKTKKSIPCEVKIISI